MSNENIEIPFLRFPRWMAVQIVPPEEEAIIAFIASKGMNKVKVTLEIDPFGAGEVWVVLDQLNGETQWIPSNNPRKLFKEIDHILD